MVSEFLPRFSSRHLSIGCASAVLHFRRDIFYLYLQCLPAVKCLPLSRRYYMLKQKHLEHSILHFFPTKMCIWSWRCPVRADGGISIRLLFLYNVYFCRQWDCHFAFSTKIINDEAFSKIVLRNLTETLDVERYTKNVLILKFSIVDTLLVPIFDWVLCYTDSPVVLFALAPTTRN